MNVKKTALVCTLVALFGAVLLARAQTSRPGAVAKADDNPFDDPDRTAPKTPPKKNVKRVDDLFGPVETPKKSPPRSFAAQSEKSLLTQPPKVFEKSEATSADSCMCVGDGDSLAFKRITMVLAGPLHSAGLDVADQPLKDVMNMLQDEYQIPIHIYTPALEEAAIGTDVPVTINLHNISLRSALKLMLTQLSLTYLIRDEVLLITTKEDAEKQMVTCVYNVQGLVDDADPKSMDALIESIYACTASKTWAENDGTGEARPLSPGLLVVMQTRAVHEEVGGLLTKIRRMREQVPIAKARQQSPAPAASHRSSGSSEQKEKEARP
jgi:hypothetical protein